MAKEWIAVQEDGTGMDAADAEDDVGITVTVSITFMNSATLVRMLREYLSMLYLSICVIVNANVCGCVVVISDVLH